MAGLRGLSQDDKLNDIQVLNRSLYFENQGVWAYDAAASKLTSTAVGKAVLSLALENKADHEKHQDLLRHAIDSLGGTPVAMEKSYDLSEYLQNGYGALDSDVNIAKLALQLEVGAAAGYVGDATQLKSGALIEMEAGIACVEAIHAARIRAAFNELGVKIPVVPNPVLNAISRNDWMLKV
jgi:hypothetical protein